MAPATTTGTKFYVDEDGDLRAEHVRPFAMLYDPGIQADAAAWTDGRTPQHTRSKLRQLLDRAKG